MTTALHLPARPGAPIACDMTDAVDTPAERLAAYRRLFATALRRRERRAGAVTFHFGAEPGTRATVEELARREAACCPFLEHRVETGDGELVWTISHARDGADGAGSEAVLDEFYAL
jgi:hypothetical protein